MWIFGTIIPYDETVHLSPLVLVDFCASCFCYGVDQLYAYSLHSFMMDVRYTIFNYSQLLWQDSYEPYYDFLVSLNNFGDYIDLLYVSYLSEYISMCISFLPSIAKDSPLFTMYTWKPGVYLSNASYYYAIANNIPQNEQYNPYIVDMYQLLMSNETLHTACLSMFQIYLVTYFIYIFVILHLDYFGSDAKKEKIIDQEFVTIQTGVLAEEELGSFDDKFFYYLFFFFIFGWFFFHAFYALITYSPIILVYLWIAPVIIYFLAYIPYNFLWNFGISFTTYLRGTGSGESIVSEFMFDIIVGVALFFRFFIQGVRLLLILFVYASLHDLWLLNDWFSLSLFSHESFFDTISELELNFSSVTYFIFFEVPFWMWYLLFEIGHTFFVITAQSFAFIAMIFWLFFFLYTCFTFDAQEEYISYKRRFFK